MTMDEKLTWIPHIKFLKNKCNKRMNLIKVLANNKWGADYEIIKRSYEALVRSKLDYGSIIYDGANKQIKYMLETINNTGARLTWGAFRTSPVISI